MKIEGMKTGQYGHPQDPEAAKNFIENLADKGNQSATNKKYWALVYGLDGYSQEPKAARSLNDELVAQGNIAP